MTELEIMGANAKAASKSLRIATDEAKADALFSIAEHLRSNAAFILGENALDVKDARISGMPITDQRFICL